ncbi:MAG TPA: hypothetical protein VF533_13425 [Solirubrobacteraceae bacterium]|jgi:hypothetical protein
MLISTKVHGVADYATSALLLAAPTVLRLKNRRSSLLLRAAGGGVLATSLLTDYELGAVRKLPMPAHLALDAATGALLAGSPWLLGLKGKHAREWLPGLVVGAGEIAAAALTERRPADRQTSAPQDPAALQEQPPTMPTGVTGERIAEQEPGGGVGPQIAPSPLETPGPSVNPPELPESETERRERADALTEDIDETLAPVNPVRMEDLAQASPEVLAVLADTDSEGPATIDPDEKLIQQQEAAAALEAAGIGGPHANSHTSDPAFEAVYEAGGGEAEGFEQAEADLIDNASHGDGGGNPLRDAIAPEAEADVADSTYGEGDDLPSTELVDDPSEGDDDPGRGPDLSADRGTIPPKTDADY